MDKAAAEQTGFWYASLMQNPLSFAFRQLPERFRMPAHHARTLVQDTVRCDLTKQASAMAYVTLLSLVPSLVAMLVYGLMGWLILRVIWPLFDRPTTRSTSTYDRFDS